MINELLSKQKKCPPNHRKKYLKLTVNSSIDSDLNRIGLQNLSPRKNRSSSDVLRISEPCDFDETDKDDCTETGQYLSSDGSGYLSSDGSGYSYEEIEQ